MMRFCESFDKYGTEVTRLTDGGLITSVSPAASLLVGGGICNSTAFREDTTGPNGFTVSFPILADQFSWGHAAYYRENIQSGSVDFSFRGPTSVQSFFRFMSDGSIQFWQGPNVLLGNLLAQSAASQYNANTWFQFEWEVTTSDTVGTVAAWIDGNSIIPFTSALNTKAVPAFANAEDYTSIFVGAVQPHRNDDIVMGDGLSSGVAGKLNNQRLGPVHVSYVIGEADSVSGGGDLKQFTPSSGTDHGAMINQNPPDDDTTFNASASPINIDTYKHGGITLNNPEIYGVKVIPVVKKSDAANVRTVRPMYRLSGGNTFGNIQTVPPEQYEQKAEIFEGNGVAEWTLANVNLMQPGLEDNS